MNLLGAHVSVAGGLDQAFVNGKEIGCDAVQIFTRNQRQWTSKPVTAEEAAAFKAARRESGIAKTVAHAAYLLNLGAKDPGILARSRAAFVAELERCEALGIDALVFHPGAHLEAGEEACLDVIVESVAGGLDAVARGTTKVLVENTAGQGTVVGYTWEHVARIMEGVGDRRRLGVCLDTQHTFAAGHDLRTPAAYAKTMGAIDATFGVDRIGCFHMNDSKMELGSRVDRHEHIGKGLLGAAAFHALLQDKRFDGLPMIVETPGEENKDWAADVQALRKLAAARTAPKGSWFVP